MPETVVLSKVARPSAPPPVLDPLAPYVPTAEKPWNARRVAHLYRRLGFGATLAQIQQGLQMSPSELVDSLLDTAADLPIPDPPYWASYTSDDYEADPNPDLRFEHYAEMRRRWLGEMLDEGVRAKMALFWHNHFVTQLNVYGCNSYQWNYYSLLHEYAFGNFRVFAREMGKTGAMLVFLNGNENVAAQPNENYARELMELFTMGESNGYTQADIVEMARALTGWRANQYECTDPFFDPAQHDNGQKTVFGQTANLNFNTAHNLVFSARADQTAGHISEKLYKFFVYETPDKQVVEGLAQTFKTAGWELMPVLKQMLKSEHFFDEAQMTSRIKSPLETYLCLWKMAGATAAEIEDNWWDAVSYWSYQVGQEIFNPVNVAGWPGHRKWINENTMTARWDYASGMAYLLTQNETLRENLRALAQALTNDSNDPALIAAALSEFFLGQTLDPVHLYIAVLYLKYGIPENYYQDGSWNLYWNEAPYQIVNQLYYMVRLPEYQLT